VYLHYKIKNVFAGVVVAVSSSAIDFIYIELFTGRSLIRMLALLTLRLILCFILDILDEPFYHVLQLFAIYTMLQPQPPASIVVPSGTVREYGGFLPYLICNCLKNR
jgi:hypothetical protein